MITDEEYLKKISEAKRPKSTTYTHDVSGSAPPPARPSAAAFMDRWKFFFPPTEEKELEGKWCACIYMQGKSFCFWEKFESDFWWTKVAPLKV